MTRVFSVNGNNDIHAVNGRLQIAEGQTAVLQNCERAIKAMTSEMIYAYNRGVNYMGTVFNGSPNVIEFEAGARAQLQRVQSVISVDAFTATVSGNALNYTATIRTEFGQGQVTNTISLGGSNG